MMNSIFTFIIIGTLLQEVYSERNDCYIVGEEKNIYTGNKSTTITGRTCQSWSSTVPHSHNYLNNPEAEGNYCRILTDSKPWCFTVDKSVRWEYCGIPECSKPKIIQPKFIEPPDVDCYEEGSLYKGNVSVTFTGLTCQRWNKQTPQKHKHSGNPDADENYCRIINDKRPWCYTTDKDVRWEYCMVPDCETTEAPTNTEASTEKPSVTRPPNGNSPKGASTIKDINPKVSIKRDRYVSDINKKISINCVVEPNNQDLAIHWYKDGSMMVNRGLNIRTGSILILKNVQKEDTGLYTCEAGNSRAFSTVLVGGATLDITTPSSERLAEKTETTTESYLTSTEDSTTTAEETETYPTTIIDDSSRKDFNNNHPTGYFYAKTNESSKNIHNSTC
uniref:Plasminogen n=1 Tax=Magallana gigas TaxID=29159 RepID=K1PAJ5_MAGGI